jgi:hypothetical protein
MDDRCIISPRFAVPRHLFGIPHLSTYTSQARSIHEQFCRQGVGGRGGPGRAEKNFYLYISREGKEPLKHVYEPLGAQVHHWELKQRAVVS